MVSKKQVEELMKKYFPSCPICRSDASYEISGIAKNYVQCRSCGAKWFIQAKKLHSIEQMKLHEACRDGRGTSLLNRNYSPRFWQAIGKAMEKGLTVCPQCLREVKRTAFACKYCGVAFAGYEKGDYEFGKMCPFAVVQVGKTTTSFGVTSGEYTWIHMKCIQEYCVLWDTKRDQCSFLSKLY